MDAITHLTNKVMAERARQQETEQAMHTLPPPPYTGPAHDSDDEDDDEAEPDEPISVTINAQHYINGSHNLVPTSPSPLADATKFSSILLTTLSQIQNAQQQQQLVATATRQNRKLKVELTINCGITIHGDRNVIGNVGVKPKPAPVAAGPVPAGADAGASGLPSPTESTVAGAKRRAKEDTDSDEPVAKRPALANSMHRDV